MMRFIKATGSYLLGLVAILIGTSALSAGLGFPEFLYSSEAGFQISEKRFDPNEYVIVLVPDDSGAELLFYDPGTQDELYSHVNPNHAQLRRYSIFHTSVNCERSHPTQTRNPRVDVMDYGTFGVMVFRFVEHAIDMTETEHICVLPIAWVE